MELTQLIEEAREKFEKDFPLKINSPHHAERYFSFKDKHVPVYLSELITQAFHAGEANVANKCMELFDEAPEEMDFEELAQTTKKMVALLEAARPGDKESKV